ncbi:hypothetical protein [Paenibacillus lignilyticus]|uniref:DUF4390 domain-containing protein n=1 Tax=Paenibacillus lignilyticus TaxID=1172615 RepID=A0ABS5CF35_9BACL|nr:hypothetical protein [Paenibacillus lignilyticus]MBP3964465.1 hypothetical protein [Paenibacillus lignilyticus]
MSHYKRLLYACAVTAAVTVLLSILPLTDSRMKQAKGDISVFHPVPIKRLSAGVIVDSMLGLHLELDVKRVDWKGSVLSVDLSAEHYGNAVEEWMSDLQRLLEFAFVHTDNVSRVLVRFVTPMQPLNDEEIPVNRLLAAVDVRRSDTWLSTELSNLSAAEPFTDEIWRQRLRLSISQL